MALVQYGALVSRLAGKLAGSVFQEGPGGSIVRSQGGKINRRSVIMQASRAITRDLQGEWKRLTQAQRTQWDALANYAKWPANNFTGAAISGQQLFIRGNYYRVRYSLSILTSPVISSCDIEAAAFTIENDTGTLYLNSDRSIDTSKEFVAALVSLPVPATINAARSLARMVVFSSSNGTQQDITSAYESVFGTLPATGDNVFIKVLVCSKLSGLAWLMTNERKEVD